MSVPKSIFVIKSWIKFVESIAKVHSQQIQAIEKYILYTSISRMMWIILMMMYGFICICLFVWHRQVKVKQRKWDCVVFEGNLSLTKHSHKSNKFTTENGGGEDEAAFNCSFGEQGKSFWINIFPFRHYQHKLYNSHGFSIISFI